MKISLFFIWAVPLLLILSACGEKSKPDIMPSSLPKSEQGAVEVGTGVEVRIIAGKTYYLKARETDIRKYTLSDIQTMIRGEEEGKNIKGKIETLSILEEGEQKEKTAYLESFVGNHAQAKTIKTSLCETRALDIDCKQFPSTLVILSPQDMSGQSIDTGKAMNLALDGEKLPWSRKANIGLSYHQVHTFRVSTPGYTDYIRRIDITPASEYTTILNPVFEKATGEKKLISSQGGNISTEHFNFLIERDSFMGSDGTPIDGEVDIYTFDLPASDLSIFNGVDIFDREDMSYLGNNFSNPHTAVIHAYQNGERLKQQKPIIVETTLSHIADNASNIDLTGAPVGIQLSQEESETLRLPFVGSLDIDRGVWLRSPLTVIDTSGKVSYPLY